MLLIVDDDPTFLEQAQQSLDVWDAEFSSPETQHMQGN